MGYTAGLAANRYYAVGFGANTAMTVGDDFNGSTCDLQNAAKRAFAAGKLVGGKTAAATWLDTATGAILITGDAFTASAVGVVSADNITQANSDYWQIDHDKILSHFRTGY